jgi:thioesterase domain-containing protein
MVAYVPQEFPGRIIFFKAAQESPINPPNPELAWQGLAARGIEVHEVPGDHTTMNFLPNVEVIARVLNEICREV